MRELPMQDNSSIDRLREEVTGETRRIQGEVEKKREAERKKATEAKDKS